MGFRARILLHGQAIAFLFPHLFLEQLPHQAGDAGVTLRRSNPGPAGHFLIHGDGDVLHNTILVFHCFRVNFASIIFDIIK